MLERLISPVSSLLIIRVGSDLASLFTPSTRSGRSEGLFGLRNIFKTGVEEYLLVRSGKAYGQFERVPELTRYMSMPGIVTKFPHGTSQMDSHC